MKGSIHCYTPICNIEIYDKLNKKPMSLNLLAKIRIKGQDKFPEKIT